MRMTESHWKGGIQESQRLTLVSWKSTSTQCME
nr:MAG TPA: hypothetical protein [Caudoviricetes sp.]